MTATFPPLLVDGRDDAVREAAAGTSGGREAGVAEQGRTVVEARRGGGPRPRHVVRPDVVDVLVGKRRRDVAVAHPRAARGADARASRRRRAARRQTRAQRPLRVRGLRQDGVPATTVDAAGEL